MLTVAKLAASVAFVVYGLACGAVRAEVATGKEAPAFVVNGLDGQKFDLSAMRGKVVLINFWATWCAPCRLEMPALEAFYRERRDQGLELIAVSVDRPRDIERVRKVMKEFTFPAAMLNEAQSNGMGEPANVPMTYVVDAGGVVRDKLSVVNRKLLTEAVLPLVRKASRAR